MEGLSSRIDVIFILGENSNTRCRSGRNVRYMYISKILFERDIWR